MKQKHDWRFLRTVLEDRNATEFKDQDIIRTKSDNCSTQYKCLHIFAMLKYMALRIGKTIITWSCQPWLRFLEDGMSSFGVKTPLRRAIIAQDFYWEKAAELVKFFQV